MTLAERRRQVIEELHKRGALEIALNALEEAGQLTAAQRVELEAAAEAMRQRYGVRP
jgi:hypothetical protein